MLSKTIKPPKFLHDIHGRSTTIFDIILTYTGGLLSVASVYILCLQNSIDISVWKLILLLLISADIGAGVIANFTKGTNSFYGGVRKKKSRLVFILSHFLHPAIFLYILDLISVKTIGLVLFVIVTTFIIDSIKNKENQRVFASFCLVSGIGITLYLKILDPLLLWFFPLYMTKLFIAFGIRRFE